MMDMTEKRFTNIEHDYENAWIKCNDDGDFMIYAIYKELDESLPSLEDLLNELHEENQLLQRHIKRNTFNKIRVEDILNCAKYDKFYDDKEAIKSIDWIAEQLGVDLK